MSKPVDKTIEKCKHKKKEKSNNKQCNQSSLKIARANGSYTLEVTPESSNSIIEIVAGKKANPQLVKCNVVGSVGPCENHLKKTFDFTEKSSVMTDTDLQFEAFAKEQSWKFWKPNLNTYSVASNRCGNKFGANINVYPDIKAEFELKFTSIKISTERVFSRSSEGDEYSDFSNEKSKEKNDFEIKGSVSEDGHTWELGVEFKHIIESIKKVSTLSNELIGKIRKLTGGKEISINPISTTFIGPSLALKFDGKYEETKGQFDVKGLSEISIKSEPLVELDISVDLIGVGLTLLPGIGTFITHMRGLAKDNLDIKLSFVAKGKISIEYGIKYHWSEKRWAPHGEKKVVGKIEFGLEASLTGKAGLKADWYFIHVAASVEGGLKGSGIGALTGEIELEDEELVVYGQFNGFKVTLQKYCSMGWGNSESGPPKKDDEESKKPNEAKPSNSYEHTFWGGEKKKLAAIKL